MNKFERVYHLKRMTVITPPLPKGVAGILAIAGVLAQVSLFGQAYSLSGNVDYYGSRTGSIVVWMSRTNQTAVFDEGAAG